MEAGFRNIRHPNRVNSNDDENLDSVGIEESKTLPLDHDGLNQRGPELGILQLSK